MGNDVHINPNIISPSRPANPRGGDEDKKEEAKKARVAEARTAEADLRSQDVARDAARLARASLDKKVPTRFADQAKKGAAAASGEPAKKAPPDTSKKDIFDPVKKSPTTLADLEKGHVRATREPPSASKVVDTPSHLATRKPTKPGTVEDAKADAKKGEEGRQDRAALANAIKRKVGENLLENGVKILPSKPATPAKAEIVLARTQPPAKPTTPPQQSPKLSQPTLADRTPPLPPKPLTPGLGKNGLPLAAAGQEGETIPGKPGQPLTVAKGTPQEIVGRTIPGRSSVTTPSTSQAPQKGQPIAVAQGEISSVPDSPVLEGQCKIIDPGTTTPHDPEVQAKCREMELRFVKLKEGGKVVSPAPPLTVAEARAQKKETLAEVLRDPKKAEEGKGKGGKASGLLTDFVFGCRRQSCDSTV